MEGDACRVHLRLVRTTQVSTKRRLTSADVSASKKMPHGGRACRWCSGEVFPPRRTYCSDACVTEWRLRSDVSFLRSQLFLRDKGVCASCGLDTMALRLRIYPLPAEERVRVGAAHGVDAYRAERLMLWEADHMVPVSKGGGARPGDATSAGLSAFQTLCIRCHRAKTAQDMLQRK